MTDATQNTVVVHFELDGGNRRAGAKAWAKAVESIDPTKGNGYGILGAFLGSRGSWEFDEALPEGTLIVCGGSGGSWKNSTQSYALFRVKRGAEGEASIGYQTYRLSGAELVASSADEVDRQEVVDRHPELAPATGSKLLAIYVALREAEMGGPAEAEDVPQAAAPTTKELAEAKLQELQLLVRKLGKEHADNQAAREAAQDALGWIAQASRCLEDVY